MQIGIKLPMDTEMNPHCKISTRKTIRKNAPNMGRFFVFFVITTYYILATLPINLLFKLAALFLWMIFLLANLSIIPTTLGKSSSAAFLSSSLRSFLIALRTVLC